MTRTRFWIALAAILALAAVLRGIYPAADPPWRASVGVVWHDEGAWTHNARNKALFGAWRQDEWNPVYIAPVFTALEYGSFATFGVGLRQARLVSQVSGVLSVLLLALSLRRLRGPKAALIGGALTATNYVYVMYGRAAIMEGLMAAFIVASWYCSVRAEREPRWGAAAGVMAALAFFTKAAAAFYIGALGLVALVRLLSTEGRSDRRLRSFRLRPEVESGAWTLAGLAISFALIGTLLILPHWSDYQFYNWQMSVTRKPSYDLASIVQRVIWFPALHDTFSRAWLQLLLAVLGAAQHGGRRQVARELGSALSRRGDYRASREELTPGGGDWLAALPVVLAAAATLARPAAWQRFTSGSVGAYSLTPAAWHALTASGAARDAAH